MTQTCPICIEEYTQRLRKEVICPYCNYTTCVLCMKQHILNQKSPNCMSCHIEFNREFVDLNMTKAFRTKELPLHRENVLVEREKSLLIETVEHAEAIVRRRTMEKECAELGSLKYDLYAQLTALEARIRQKRNDFYEAEATNGVGASTSKLKKERKTFIKACVVNGCRGFLSSQYKCGICETWVCPHCHEIKQSQKDDNHTCNPDMVESVKMIAKETKPCPKCAAAISKVSGCFAQDTPILLWNGETKMSQDVKVGDVLVGDDGLSRNVLHLFSGEDELYEVSQNKGVNYIVNSKHTLVLKMSGDEIQMNVEEYLKLDDFSKVGLLGFKINKDFQHKTTSISVKHIGRGNYFGWAIDDNKKFLLPDMTVVRNCDQMWCTECQTTFSWNSGQEITTSNIHNPHYYEWLRRNNNGEVPRNPLDNPCGGNELPNAGTLMRLYPTSTTFTRIFNLLRCLSHMRDYDVIRNQNNDVVTQNRDLRIKYLLKELDEAVWKKELQQREKKRDFKLAKSQVCEMIIQVAGEFLHQLARSKLHNNKVNEIVNDLEKIVKYYNESMQKVHDRFISKAKAWKIKEDTWTFSSYM
jgi:Hom_end-associated Hint